MNEAVFGLFSETISSQYCFPRSPLIRAQFFQGYLNLTNFGIFSYFYSKITRRGNKEKIYFRCYFNAVSCYRRKWRHSFQPPTAGRWPSSFWLSNILNLQYQPAKQLNQLQRLNYLNIVFNWKNPFEFHFFLSFLVTSAIYLKNVGITTRPHFHRVTTSPLPVFTSIANSAQCEYSSRA